MPLPTELIWYHTDEGDLPAAHRLPWTAAGSGASVSLVSKGVQINQATSSEYFFYRLPSGPRTSFVGSVMELQADRVSVASSAPSWSSGAGPVCLSICDGVRSIGISLGPTLRWIDPTKGDIIREARVSHPYATGHAVRLRKVRSTTWEVWIDGELVDELPYAAAVDDATVARWAWGHFDQTGKSVSTWEGVEAALNLAVAPAGQVRLLREARLPSPLRRAWSTTTQAVIRAILGMAEQAASALREAYDLHTDGGRSMELATFDGDVLPTADGWTVNNGPGTIARERWRLSGDTLDYAEWELPDATEEAEVRIAATFRVEESATVDAQGRIGPYLEARNGDRQLRAELVRTGERAAWRLAEGPDAGPVTFLVSEPGFAGWRVDERQAVRVEIRLLGRGDHGRAVLLVNDVLVDEVLYSDLTEAVVSTLVRVGKVAGLGGAMPSGAWIHVDPWLNPGTITASYNVLPDISGNGRDMAENGYTCAISTAQTVNGGTQVLPLPTSLNTLYHDHGGSFISSTCTWFGWSHHGTPQTNPSPMGPFLWAPPSPYGSVLTLRWESTTGAAIAAAGVGPAVPSSPSVPFPINGSTADAVYFFACRREDLGASIRWTLWLYGDMDDGAGMIEYSRQSWTESTTISGSAFQLALASAEGVTLASDGAGGKPAGGGAWFLTALTDNQLKEGLIYAAGLFSDAHQTALAALLGGGIEATCTIEDVEGELRYSDPSQRPVFDRVVAERLVFAGGCERNDHLDTLVRHHHGVQELRGSFHATWRELSRLTCSQDTSYRTDEHEASWYLEQTYPEITPVFLEAEGTFVVLKWEIRNNLLQLTLDELTEIALGYLLPLSVTEMRYELWLATDLASTPVVGASSVTFDVDETRGFAVGDAVELRESTGAGRDTTTILSIVGDTVEVGLLTLTHTSGSVLRRLLGTT